jgi:spore coat polysaccharide biosynthesis protein SpsF (cytidylyltransferase family)
MTSKKVPRIGFIVQARLGSSRLPKKVLRKFHNGETLISIITTRLKKSLFYSTDNIIVATTHNQRDDELYRYCIENDIQVVRGSEENVLDRFYCAARKVGFEYVVRICSDNPFLDVDLLDLAITQLLENNDSDYVSFSIHDKPAMLTHYGFFSEVFTFNSIAKLRSITSQQEDLEHVTKGMYTRPLDFKCRFMDLSEIFAEGDTIRTTIDSIDDFDLVDSIYKDLLKWKAEFNFLNVLSFIKNNPYILQKMEKQIETNKK